MKQPFSKYYVVLEAISPIVHGDSVSNNDGTNITQFMKTPVVVDGWPCRIPTLSGNALRSGIIRATLADNLLAQLDLKKDDIPKSVVVLLYSGGNMAKGAKQPGDMFSLSQIAQSNYPMLELLGCCFDNFMSIESRLAPGCYPVAKEYTRALKLLKAPKDTVEHSKNVSIEHLLGEKIRFWGNKNDYVPAIEQRIFENEVLAAGTKFYIELILKPNTSELAKSALGFAWNNWIGLFGGQNREGMGRMAIIDSNLPDQELYANWKADKQGLMDGTFGTSKVLCAL